MKDLGMYIVQSIEDPKFQKVEPNTAKCSINHPSHLGKNSLNKYDEIPMRKVKMLDILTGDISY
ncbi:hypothetical protein AM593_00754, partial [Mytilus galloprovincialis]